MEEIKKVMISQPMRGKTDDEIVETREKAIAALEGKGYEVVNTLFTDEWYSKEAMEERGVVQIPVCFLSKSIENMSLCHAAYFCAGWEDARGYRIEHDVATAYGLDILYETEPEEKPAKCTNNRLDAGAVKKLLAKTYRLDADNLINIEYFSFYHGSRWYWFHEKRAMKGFKEFIAECEADGHKMEDIPLVVLLSEIRSAEFLKNAICHMLEEQDTASEQ